MIALSSTGLGIAIIPKTSALLNQNKNLIYKEVSEPILPLYANIIWSRNRYLSNIAKNFLEMLQNSPMPLASKT
jgi:DNA-binding transcriptional LysR family regulator